MPTYSNQKNGLKIPKFELKSDLRDFTQSLVNGQSSLQLPRWCFSPFYLEIL